MLTPSAHTTKTKQSKTKQNKNQEQQQQQYTPAANDIMNAKLCLFSQHRYTQQRTARACEHSKRKCPFEWITRIPSLKTRRFLSFLSITLPQRPFRIGKFYTDCDRPRYPRAALQRRALGIFKFPETKLCFPPSAHLYALNSLRPIMIHAYSSAQNTL